MGPIGGSRRPPCLAGLLATWGQVPSQAPVAEVDLCQWVGHRGEICISNLCSSHPWKDVFEPKSWVLRFLS